MVEIYDAHEQGEIVKKWLRENGGAIVFGLVLAFGGLFGFRQYQAWQVNEERQAFAEYELLGERLTASQLDLAVENFQLLRDEHASSPYASLAALLMARARLESSQPDLAETYLRFVMEQGQPNGLRSIARQRLARVLLSLDRADEALQVIDGGDSDRAGQESRFAETRGDILVALGRGEEAIPAYREALESLEEGLGDRDTLVLKLEELGVTDVDEENAS